MSCCSSRTLLLFPLLLHAFVACVSAQGSVDLSSWPTLSGNPPIVVARGKISALFPDLSIDAYRFPDTGTGTGTGTGTVTLWCDVQLTKDGVGICIPNLRLDNATHHENLLGADRRKVYIVNGAPTMGLFTVDFTFNELTQVPFIRGGFSGSKMFDGNLRHILDSKDVSPFSARALWLNIQHDQFFTQQNLSMRNYVLSVSRRTVVDYISSPEVEFLRSIAARFNHTTTKLILRILGPTDIEVTTNQTYDSLLRNLTFIKTFASGILVHKTYLWPMDRDGYIQPPSSLVSDAHKAKLEVFASEFYSDYPLVYNYSHDPITEYLSYIDNGNFSVDGVLTDFPISPLLAIDCFAHLYKDAKSRAKPLVISKFGASGDLPACTDLAYSQAISDGVEVLDCPVQIAKDGTPFCMSSINLIDSTTISQTPFTNRSKKILEIGPNNGIFAFDFTWDEIRGLTPLISKPFSRWSFFRNPRFRNSGKFITLSDFLALAKNASTLSGVLIQIENAAYLAKEHGLRITDVVLDSLSKAGYDNQTALKVMIQSPNSSVLIKFKEEKKKYELVYEVGESINDVLNSAVVDIKSFADSVTISKTSVFPVNQVFTIVVNKLKSHNLSVYVQTFSNEFLSQPWDFLLDPTVEINSYVRAGIDGVVTDFPKTSARYKKHRCDLTSLDSPLYMRWASQPGKLLLC